MRQVLEDLRRGIPERARDSFRRRVLGTIDQVEEICRKAGTSPWNLPAPSRNAYRFLRDLDLGDLPAPRSDSEPAPRTIPVRNVVRIGTDLAERLWSGRAEILSDRAAARRIRADARGDAEAIEGVCSDRGGTPAAIPLPSRRMFCWLQFLGEGDNLLRHVAALERGCRAVSGVRPDLVETVRIRLENFTPLWKTKKDRRGLLIRCSEGFIDAPRETWEALAADATGSGTQASRLAVREYGESEDFAEVFVDLDSRASPDRQAAGVHHDLSASFDRLNTRYFGGRLSKPRLHWNNTQTIRKFGHYQRSRDSVMVSIALDDPQVPEFVIDSVVHHELLHRVLGVEVRDGRMVAHSPGFRREERRFARCAEAQAFLRRLADSLR